MKKSESCGNCMFCLVNAHGQSECRRHSPTAFTTKQKSRVGPQVQMAVVTFWPPVNVDLWCGDHMPAPPTLEKV